MPIMRKFTGDVQIMKFRESLSSVRGILTYINVNFVFWAIQPQRPQYKMTLVKDRILVNYHLLSVLVQTYVSKDGK